MKEPKRSGDFILGNYRLTHLLGRGGFAEVYLGEHQRLGTRAAIKILYAHLTETEADNFLAEARTIAHLEHPHIIRILDFDVQNDRPFLVMGYAPNGSLRSRHPRGTRLPLPVVQAYVQQIAAALQYAHDHKVIHRDIKPENMLLGREGEVYLSDFGIALIAQSSHVQHIQSVVGTAIYMAPEQLQGKPRFASDQYALGIVIYEWLTGERPFQGTFLELYSQHLTAPPPSMRTIIPALPAQLDYVIQTALTKDPAQRFESIRAFAAALDLACQSPASILVGKLTSRLEALSTLVPSANSPSDQIYPSPPAPDLPVLPSPVITPPRAVPIGKRLLSVSTAPSKIVSEHLSAPSASSALSQHAQQPVSRRTALLGISTLLAGGTGWWLLTRHSRPATAPIPSRRLPGRNTAQGQNDDLPLTNILARDTFQRDDQIFWGTAADGRQWEGDANQQPAFSIAHTTGRISNGKGTLNALLGAVSSDTEVMTIAAINSFANDVNFGLVLRWSNGDNWYKALLDGKHLSILRRINGQTDTLKTLDFVVLSNRPYKLRFRTIGVVLLAKAWPAHQDEPTDWQITATDNMLMSGRAGLRAVIQSETTITITSFMAASGSMSNASTL